MTPSFAPYEHTRLWEALAATITQLQDTGELRVETAPEYVVAYLCQELAAKRLVTPAALELD